MNKDKYVRFIEVGVSGMACNFKCNYCYVSQLETPSNDVAKFEYSPEHIGKALRKERVGGLAYINICGHGETLISKDLPRIIYEILKQGHYVNIYTNGTLTSRFDEILAIVPKNDLIRLSFAFSFHYLELKRLDKLDTFFSNFNKMKSNGCSVVANMVLDDCYLPYAEEIKEISIKNLGAFPQISFPKKNNKKGNWTSLCEDEDKTIKIGKSFQSPYLDFTERFFNYDRKRFCYAGAWSFVLDLANGWISKCYGHRPHQNIYKDLNKPIKYQAVGNFCFSQKCGGGLLLPQGLVPSLESPSYPEIKDRPEANWYTEQYKSFLSQQLISNNRQYSVTEKIIANILQPLHEARNIAWAGIRKFRKR